MHILYVTILRQNTQLNVLYAPLQMYRAMQMIHNVKEANVLGIFNIVVESMHHI